MSMTNYDGRLEAMATYCESMYVNLAVLNNVYTESIINAYSYSLPAKYADVYAVKKLGGATVGFSQLVDSGTTKVTTVTNHKYYTLISGVASIVTGDGTDITITDDETDMVIDMTLLFGYGNEPASTSDFEAIFPAEHYAYNSGTLFSAGVAKIVSKDGDDNVIDTCAVPDEVQALDGYGCGAISAYNYVDYERKMFVQNVGKIVLGNSTWTHSSTSGHELHYANATGAKFSGGVLSNMFAKGNAYNHNADKVIQIATNNSRIWIYDSSKIGVTGAQFKSYLAEIGAEAYYELETPVETDISGYLKDIHLKVVAGGSLVFENQHGDEYRIPVPAEVAMIGVS